MSRMWKESLEFGVSLFPPVEVEPLLVQELVEHHLVRWKILRWIYYIIKLGSWAICQVFSREGG